MTRPDSPDLVLGRAAFRVGDRSALFKITLRLMRPFIKSTAQGAATSIYLASSPREGA
jgi:hypothetical protein